MGGKGRKRREKNYKAAHGGHTRLPPPPDPSQVDALPSKLRKIMSLASSDGTAKVALEKRKRGDGDGDGDGHKKGSLKNVGNEEARGDDRNDEIAHGNDTNEKRKKKRKRKQVSDLRLETAGEHLSVSKRKERKKK